MVTLLWLAALTTGSVRAQAQTTGQWSAVQNWPYVVVHTTLLPTGKVLFYSYYSDSLYPQIWDPATNSVSPAASSTYELFCSGHTLMADGRVLVTGGHIADYVGEMHASIYDPFDNTWTPVPDMNAGRWYPTNTTLPNGDILVVSGDETSNTTPDPLPQVYQVATNSWRNLSTAQFLMPMYPVMLLAPNGQVFYAGPSNHTRYLDTSGTGAWTIVAYTNFGAYRDYGPGVMYDAGKVLIVGGHDPPASSAEIINLNSSTPAWTYTGAMHYARRQHNAVLMPDGKVFVVGGSSGSGFDNSSAPVYPAEMWNPSTGSWTVMASISKYRGYHSVALLLPDGRVLSAGGNDGGANYQLFSPPYLFNGKRPAISSTPSNVGYGQTIFVGTPDAASITKVTWLRLGSTTHTFDQSQRFLQLSFSQATGGLNVTMPASANLSPPGHYMLFILNSSGVPSVAQIVQIIAGGGSTGNITGKVTDTSGTALAGATVSGGGDSSTTDGTGAYTLANITAGSVTVAASLSGYQDSSETVTVSAGTTATATTLTLAPTNAGTITGTVTDTSSTALAGATVSAGGLSTTTSSTGTYTLSNVPAGSVTVTASAAGYLSASQTVSVTSGASTTANFTLTPNSGTITGAVTNSSGTAISGAGVSYGGGSTITNSSGVYTLNKVPPGSIQLTASASGYATSAQTVTVTAGATTTANFTLIFNSGTITGTVKNSTGSAISGATVSYTGASTTTNSSGAYTLNNVPAGSVSITAAASGYVNSTQTVSVTAGTTNTANFTLSTAPTTGAFAGNVTNLSTGGALSGATVKYSAGSTTTNSTGNYNFNNVTTGTYSVTASATGYIARTSSVTVSGGTTTTLNFGLATGGIIAGVVKNSSGVALSGATVKITGGAYSATYTVTTNSTGNYNSNWIPTGSYTVAVSMTGYTTQTKSATANTGATTTLNFTL